MLEYGGFWLEGEKGNNAFTYQQRKENARLRVPNLKELSLSVLKLGKLPVFSESNGRGQVEYFSGLECFLFFEEYGVPIYVFDNHNHAFAFWYREFFKGTIARGIHLLHVDQHSDMQENQYVFEKEDWESVVEFTNFFCTVGNFITPALQSGIIATVEQIRTECKLLSTQKPHQNYILDLDLDFFDPQMGIANYAGAVVKIKNLMSSAKVVTIATSPYFLDQEYALELLAELFS